MSEEIDHQKLTSPSTRSDIRKEVKLYVPVHRRQKNLTASSVTSSSAVIESKTTNEEITLKKEIKCDIIPSSIRSDGSIRKEIKVRKGYKPVDEQPRYIPVHRRQKDKSDKSPVTCTSSTEISEDITLKYISNKKEIDFSNPMDYSPIDKQASDSNRVIEAFANLQLEK